MKSGDRYDQITEYLNNPGLKVDPNFKHWITKERQFSLQDLPDLGLNGVLACPAKQKKGVSTCTNQLRSHLATVGRVDQMCSVFGQTRCAIGQMCAHLVKCAAAHLVKCAAHLVKHCTFGQMRAHLRAHLTKCCAFGAARFVNWSDMQHIWPNALHIWPNAQIGQMRLTLYLLSQAWVNCELSTQLQ